MGNMRQRHKKNFFNLHKKVWSKFFTQKKKCDATNNPGRCEREWKNACRSCFQLFIAVGCVWCRKNSLGNPRVIYIVRIISVNLIRKVPPVISRDFFYKQFFSSFWDIKKKAINDKIELELSLTYGSLLNCSPASIERQPAPPPKP